MRGGLRKALFVTLVVTACGFLLALFPALFGLADLRQGIGFWALVSLAGLAAGLAGLWIMLTLLDGHFDQMLRLNGAVLGAGVRGGTLPESWTPAGGRPDELHRLAGAIATVLVRDRADDRRVDARLSAILGAIGEPILVVTQTGLVSLTNARATALLGRDRLRLGGSIFAILDREALVEASAAAHAAGAPVERILPGVGGDSYAARIAPLDEPDGLLLVFLSDAPSPVSGPVEHDMALHDMPPAIPLGPDLPLAGLPAVSLDCETTGLNVATDRVVSAAGIVMHGPRLYRHLAYDRLVNPGVPVPASSTAIHGITDAMVADAPPISLVLADLAELLRGRVVIGHNISFDLAVLRAEAARHGVAWTDPPALCTALLFSFLYPRQRDLNMEAVAAMCGAEIEGRHTAFGDCLVTAEIFAGMLPLLAERGVTTLADAERVMAQPSVMRARQQEAGWHAPTDGKAGGK
ncbi:MAG: exonuclease domain-containing protein [Oceanibaculum sp.]